MSLPADLSEPEIYVEKLIAALNHEEPMTRVRAAWILGQRHEMSALPALLDVAQRGGDPDLLAAVAGALGKIGDPSAIPALIRLARSSYLKARVEAVASLSHFDTPEVNGALESASGDANVVVRREAARALERLQHLAGRREV